MVQISTVIIAVGLALYGLALALRFALRYAHQVVSHGPSTVENGSSFVCACFGRLLLSVVAASKLERSPLAVKDPTWAFSSRLAICHGQAAVFNAGLNLWLSQIGFACRATRVLRSRCCRIAASEGIGILTALSANAAAAREANKAPEHKLSHPQCYTATTKAARARHRSPPINQKDAL